MFCLSRDAFLYRLAFSGSATVLFLALSCLVGGLVLRVFWGRK